jgi:hypothetical protein
MPLRATPVTDFFPIIVNAMKDLESFVERTTRISARGARLRTNPIQPPQHPVHPR